MRKFSGDINPSVAVEVDGKEIRVLVLDREDAEVVREVVDVVGEILRTKRHHFSNEARAHGRVSLKATPLGKKLQSCLKLDFVQASVRLEGQRIHPYFEAFNALAPRFDIDLMLDEGLATRLNDFVEALRSACCSTEAKRRIDNAKRVERANAKSAKKLLNDARRSKSKILALRFDLEYLAHGFPIPHERTLSLGRMKEHREAFLHLLRTGGYAKSLVGYLWKTEWGLQRGFHHHLLVLLDGQQVCSDIRIAADLCAQWKHVITKGVGTSHNCNQRKESYRRCGIGMLARGDDEKWEILGGVVRYITKADVYVKGVADDEGQYFGMGGVYECGPAVSRKRNRLRDSRPGPARRALPFTSKRPKLLLSPSGNSQERPAPKVSPA